jgi:hypothetical protein
VLKALLGRDWLIDKPDLSFLDAEDIIEFLGIGDFGDLILEI